MIQELQDHLTINEIAKLTGLTKYQVKKIENKALKKLKHPSFSKKLKEYLTT